MAVLISDMELPVSCVKCRFAADGWCYAVRETDRQIFKLDNISRPSGCPLFDADCFADKPSKTIKAEDYAEIIDYLNEATGARYRSSTPKTRKLIQARFNEGFSIDDFKIVIDKKTRAWMNDEKMQKFLRPETLFGTKFEGYLNEQETYKLQGNKQKENSFQRMQRMIYEGAFNE